MKKLKIIRFISIIIIISFILFLISHAILCMKMTYPHPMLGIDAFKWQDQFFLDLQFIFLLFGIPLILDIIAFIVSCLKIRKLKLNTQEPKPKKEEKKEERSEE